MNATIMKDQEYTTPLIFSIKDGQINVNTETLSQILDNISKSSASVNGASNYPNKIANGHQSNEFLIVTVLGPPGSGKSFFLNWLNRYFWTNGSSKWIKEYPQQALGGFDWNPYYPDESGRYENDDGGHGGGIRVLRDIPTLSDEDDGKIRKASVILLDVDLRNKDHPEFKKFYTALTTSCVLMSTVTIYVDASPNQTELFDPQLMLTLLSRVLSDSSTKKTQEIEMISLQNQYSPREQQPAELMSKFWPELKKFCSNGNIPFVQYELPTLKLTNSKAGQFLGEVEKMNTAELKRLMSRIGNVDGLLRKVPQDKTNIFAMIQAVTRKINAFLNPNEWSKLMPLPLSVEVSADQPTYLVPTAVIQIRPDQNIVAQFRQNRAMSKKLERCDTHEPVQHHRQTSQTDASNNSNQNPNANPLEQPLQTRRRPAKSRTHNDDIDKPSDNQNEECKEQGSGPSVKHQPDPEALPIVAPTATPKQGPEVVTADSKVLRIFKNEEEVDNYLTEHCQPEFEFILRASLRYFMAPRSSVVRQAMLEALIEDIIARNFEANIPVKMCALEKFHELVTKSLQKNDEATEAIDKGRQVIENEFESAVYLADENEITKLVSRARKYANDRFKPKDAGQVEFFDKCWEAIEQNTKQRNETVRKQERGINQAAIHLVYTLYSEELLKMIAGLKQDEFAVDVIRIIGANEVLIADCLQIFANVKDYLCEAEAVRENLKCKMAKFYHEIIGSRIEEFKSIQRQQEKELEALSQLRQKEIEENQRRLAEKGLKSGLKSLPHPFNENSSTAPLLATATTETLYAIVTKGFSNVNTAPMLREKVTVDEAAEAWSCNAQSQSAPTPATSADNQGPILVLHLGRAAAVEIVPVGNFQHKFFDQIPAYVAVVNGQFVFGEAAMGVEDSICLQNICAGEKAFILNSKQMRYEQIFGLFLANYKKIYEQRMASVFSHCLIIIPAMYHSVQRQAIIDSAIIAGFTQVTLINESSVVAFDYYQNIYLSAMNTRSADLALVLYFGANGEKELILCQFSPHQHSAEPEVQVKAMTGSALLPHLSYPISWQLQPWNTYSEYKKYAHDMFTSAGVPDSNKKDRKLILGGDSHEIVLDNHSKVDISNTVLQPTQPNCAIQGATLMALRLIAGAQKGALVREKLGNCVRMKFPSGYLHPKSVFKRNTDFDSRNAVTVPIGWNDRTLTVQLVNDELGSELGRYKINIRKPRESLIAYYGYAVKCEVELSDNGILSLTAKLEEKVSYNEYYSYSLCVERLDQLNLEPVSMHNCKKFMASALRDCN